MSRNSISPYVLKPPRVFVTRDFPEGCNALAYQVEGNEDRTGSSKGKEVNSPTNTPTRAEGKTVISPANPWSRDYVNIGSSSAAPLDSDDENIANETLKGKQVNSPTNTPTRAGGKTVISPANPWSRASVNIASSSAVPRDADDENNAKETLKRFREIYRELSDEYERNRKPGDKKATTRFDLKAAGRLKGSRNWVHPENRFGHIPGIEIGDTFQYRAELAVVGLHGPYVSGIDYTVARDGTKYATSVVNSGIYENEARTADVLIYSGQGGQGRGEPRSDQKLTRCNRALANSMRLKYPVRVIRKTGRADGPPVFTYDGLYVVHKYWQERDELDLDGRVVFKFELHRVLDQET